MAQLHTMPETLPLPLEDQPPVPLKENRQDAVSDRVSLSSSPAKERSSPAQLESAFTQLLGRKATPQELAELHRVRNALNLQDNDALWLVLLALDHYRGEIKKAVFDSLEHAKTTAKATVENAGQEYLKQLFPKLLTNVTDRITAKAFGFNGSVVITGVIVLVTLVILGLGGSSLLAYGAGERAGQKQCVAAETKTGLSSPPTPTVPKGRGR